MNNEDIVWLDGYLKGVVAASRKVGGATFNALAINLPGDDISHVYMEFINEKDEEEVLDSSYRSLELSKGMLVSNWEEIVTTHINNVFSGLESMQQRVISQILDMLDLVVTNKPVSALLCKGKLGSSHGDYLFLQISGANYLVLSFLYS